MAIVDYRKGVPSVSIVTSDEFIDIQNTPISENIQNIPLSLKIRSPVPVNNPKGAPETWIVSSTIIAPPPNTSLVSRTVGAGKQGFIYGFFIDSSEPNEFLIGWTSSGNPYTIRIIFQFEGEVIDKETIPLNEGLPADALSPIIITNVNAGGLGTFYQAELLFAEI